MESHSTYPLYLAKFIHKMFLRFIHIIARINSLFLFTPRKCVPVLIYYSLLIISPVLGI